MNHDDFDPDEERWIYDLFGVIREHVRESVDTLSDATRANIERMFDADRTRAPAFDSMIWEILAEFTNFFSSRLGDDDESD